jgi:hypothetical protein
MGIPTTRHPGRVVFQAEDADRLARARRQMADEVAALRAARHEPENERRRRLSDLASHGRTLASRGRTHAHGPPVLEEADLTSSLQLSAWHP